MGSFDGAEIYELIGIHILSLLSNKLDKQSSLYRDDGLYFKETHPNREQTEYEMT